jgi:hypothetical protein
MFRASVPVLLLALIAFAISACGDTGFAFWFRNETDSAVAIQFIERDGGSGTGFSVGPNTVGGSFLAIGPTTWSGRLRVVAIDGCTPLGEHDVLEAPGGAVIVSEGGGVRVISAGPGSEPEASEVPIPAAPETGTCFPDGVTYAPVNGS